LQQNVARFHGTNLKCRCSETFHTCWLWMMLKWEGVLFSSSYSDLHNGMSNLYGISLLLIFPVTTSQVASRLFLRENGFLTFQRPVLTYVNTCSRTPIEIHFKYLRNKANLLHYLDMLHNLCFIFHKMLFIS
jgi:hypothetical protein